MEIVEVTGWGNGGFVGDWSLGVGDGEWEMREDGGD